MSENFPASIENFLACQTFAVAGVSSNETRFGTLAYRDLAAAGKTVWGINPRLEELDGQKVYADVASLPQSPEILVLVVNAKIGLGLVEQAAARGVKGVWMQPGAESEELIERCGQLGLAAVHNQCVMRQLARRPS